MRICLRLGNCLCVHRVELLNKCLVASRLLLRLHSFMAALLMGNMVGLYVRIRYRLFFDVCCFCLKDLLWYFGHFIPLF